MGGGLDYIWGEMKATGAELDDDGGIGAYLRAGLGWQFTFFQLGIDLRAVLTDAEVEGQDLGSVQAGIFVGLSL